MSKLSDISDLFSAAVTAASGITTYEFGEISEVVNANHNRTYPALIFTPPITTIVNARDIRKSHNTECVLYFLDLYQQSEQATTTLDDKLTALEDIAMEVLEYGMGTAFDKDIIPNGTVTLERAKDAFNDKLVWIKVTFGIRTDNC